MRRALLHLLIFTGFAAALGWFAEATFTANTPGEYAIGGRRTTLRAPAPQGRVLYLRRDLHLPQRPRSAWLEVLAHDDVGVYINGTIVQKAGDAGRDVGLLFDIAPHLVAGRNVLAIVANQLTLHRPPEVAVRGTLRFDGEARVIDASQDWRCARYFERKHDYWFAVDFDDSDWRAPERSDSDFHATLAYPPAAILTPPSGRWITASDADARSFAVRRRFDVDAPRSGWLCVESTAPVRVAVNGDVIAVHEERLGTAQPVAPVRYLYDISQMLRPGRNAVAVAVQREVVAAHVRVDLGVEDADGRQVVQSSGPGWRWCPLPDAAWLSADDTTAWRDVQTEAGDLGFAPADVGTSVAPLILPFDARLDRARRSAAWMAGFGLAAWLATWLFGRLVSGGRRRGGVRVSPVALAFVAPAVLAGAAILSTYDARILARDVFQPPWLLALLALVPLQWLIVAIAARIRGPAQRVSREPKALGRRSGVAIPGLLLLIVLVGGVIRFARVDDRPLTPDESSMYRATMGMFERGFPSAVVREDVPVGYVATSELVYFSNIIPGLLTDDPRWIVRGGTAFWATVTIVLIFVAGAHLFHPWVGLVAAVLYAFGPVFIDSATVGRYYSQLQFFTMLTLLLFYLTLEPPGALNVRALWGTVVAFCCMFLSWEGSALLAVPMMLSALLLRGRDLRPVLCEPRVYAGMLVVGLVVVGQGAYRTLIQVRRLAFGTGASDIALTPMWTFPDFDLWYYLRVAAWTPDTLIPMALLALGLAIAVRHPFQRAARYLAIIFFTQSLFQVAILPVTSVRYAYHFAPAWVLLAAAGLVALAHALSRVDRAVQRPLVGAYGRTVATLLVAVVCVFGTGTVFSLSELRTWRGGGTELSHLSVPDQEAAVAYINEHLAADDIIISGGPHAIDLYLPRPSDYWLQTIMHLQAILPDSEPVPLHRLKGARMLEDLDALREVFSRNRRVWFITQPSFNARLNLPETNEFLRRNMDVVYEDFGVTVFLREAHRPVVLQDHNEQSLEQAKVQFLP